MGSYEIGDYVEILCHDGATFKGVLMFFNDDYLILNGYGYPLEDIVAMDFA